MYAMIATSVALAVWTAGLSWVSKRAEDREQGKIRPSGGEEEKGEFV